MDDISMSRSIVSILLAYITCVMNVMYAHTDDALLNTFSAHNGSGNT